MRKQVIARIQVEGFHLYEQAPEEVKFLSSNHRHVFNITAAYDVEDLNREKEIFIQRDILKNYIEQTYGEPAIFGGMSCEMIASELMEFGKNEGMTWCEVWEENTGGARVEL